MACCSWLVLTFLLFAFPQAKGDAENRAAAESHNDSVFILLVVALLILAVLTIWLFKVKRFRFVHETGLSMIYGMIAGAIIRYTGVGIYLKGSSIVIEEKEAPFTLFVSTMNGFGENYTYHRKSIVHSRMIKGDTSLLEKKAVFDPEIFFYALLPPIIFFAGYDMKKRFFFRNLGAILTFAFIGTTVSCVVFGGLMYGFVSMFPSSRYPGFGVNECLLFGSLISATDPVTILAIFHDLNVEVDLYAIVFGESVMNDAVAIVLYRSIMHYSKVSFSLISFFKALGEFFGVFAGSFALGSIMGLGTALLTKLTRIKEFPRLETALFTLMSYSTFLIAEVAGLTGIVTVLFCGIVQAHYTYNNLSKESQVATKEIFGLLNFLAENFIFSYMGLSVFTFEDHQWDAGFISWSFLGIAISRACNIYPLSFILNLKRSKKIHYNSQHMLFFGGLRGAVAFALAIRNTEGMPRQLMLTSVLVVALVTVIFNGGLTTQALTLLGIRVNVDPNEEITRSTSVDGHGEIHEEISYDRSLLVNKWHQFDVRFMKPLFTNKGGQVNGFLPKCCSSCCPTEPMTEDDVYGDRREIVMDNNPSIDEEMLDVTSENRSGNSFPIPQDRYIDATFEGNVAANAVAL